MKYFEKLDLLCDLCCVNYKLFHHVTLLPDRSLPLGRPTHNASSSACNPIVMHCGDENEVCVWGGGLDVEHNT